MFIRSFNAADPTVKNMYCRMRNYTVIMSNEIVNDVEE
jgi:hypothetical protein